MPIFYFATQATAAPFYPGYSFSREAASMLGTGNSRQPWVFNAGIMLSGIAAILGSFGLYKAFRPTSGVRLTRLTVFCVAYTGFMLVKAGIFPMPDRRHSSPGGSFTIMLPLLLLIATWTASRRLRSYLFLSTLLLLPVVPMIDGKIRIAGLEGGTLQRLFALATLVPVGVVGFFFLRRERRRLAQSPSRKLS